MDREFVKRIDEEVERYKNALLYYAKLREWDTFKSKAGRLFDYLEALELSVLERKFFRIFRVVLGVLSAAVIIIWIMRGDASARLLRFKDLLVLIAIGGSCFELYFFVDFRVYVNHKMAWYRKRREQFIRDIEKDFKDIIVHPGMNL